MSVPAKEPGSPADFATLPLFRGLSPRFVEELARRRTVRSFAAGTVLWVEGTPATRMHVVLSGEVRVVRSHGGRQRVMHRETRGGTLGDVALFSGERYPATAIAATNVTTVALDRAALHALIELDASFALRLLGSLASRVRHVLGVIDRITTWSVQARLAHHVLERARRAATETFTLGMTQQELAEELGTVREVVVRTLAELHENGAIERAARGRYRLRDAVALESLARPTKP